MGDEPQTSVQNLTTLARPNVEDIRGATEAQEELPFSPSFRTTGLDAQGVSAKSFSGVSLDEVIVLEVFAGTARLTRAIRDAGLSAMAIEKDKTRTQSVHIAQYDLNDPDQLHALSDFIRRHHERILWAHFAPSCGTASRARGRPLPKLERMGIKVPRPLRSDKQPSGLDGLTGLDKVKAETVNITYDSTCTLIRLCSSLAIAVSLKIPRILCFGRLRQSKISFKRCLDA